MILRKVPASKVGTVFHKPSWRFDAILHPDLYGFTDFLSRSNGSDSGHLKRLLSKDLVIDIAYKQPDFLRRLLVELNGRQAEMLNRIWDRTFFTLNKRKAAITHKEDKKIPSWNLQKTERVGDEWLKRLVKHTFNYEYDSSIAFAIELHAYNETKEIFKHIGLSIFAGYSDAEIAKQWGILSVKHITAVRNIFFDFTSMPKDDLAKVATLKQWAKSGVIDEETYKYYRRIHDLGQLGLKAQVAYMHLDEDERRTVDRYMARSALMHVLNMDFSIKSLKDARGFMDALFGLARINFEQEAIKHKGVEIEYMRTNMEKVRKDIGRADVVSNATDLELLNTIISNSTMEDGTPSYKTYPELLKENNDAKNPDIST